MATYRAVPISLFNNNNVFLSNFCCLLPTDLIQSINLPQRPFNLIRVSHYNSILGREGVYAIVNFDVASINTVRHSSTFTRLRWATYILESSLLPENHLFMLWARGIFGMEETT